MPIEGVLMVLSQEESERPVRLYDNPGGYLICKHCNGYYELEDSETPEDFETCSCGSPLVYVTNLTEIDFSQREDMEFSENISRKVSLMNHFSSQGSFAEDVLKDMHHERENLWENIEHLQPSDEDPNHEIVINDVIESNRLMMMVDQKRALENPKPSRLDFLSKKVGLIGFLGVLIVILILILTLNVLENLF